MPEETVNQKTVRRLRQFKELLESDRPLEEIIHERTVARYHGVEDLIYGNPDADPPRGVINFKSR